MAFGRYRDHRSDPAVWAEQLGISADAVNLYLASDVIDLHTESFIWTRALGYDLRARHGTGPLAARYMGQVDFPRAREAALTGVVWSIATSPARSAAGRARAFERNLARLQRIIESVPDELCLVRNASEYRSARERGLQAAFLGIQGGNALDRDLGALELLRDDLILRVTLVHLSRSRIGSSSAPSPGADLGLTDFGRQYVEALNQRRVFVDLAHISRRGFFQALEVHDRSLPVMVSHTGVCGVHDLWRNLTDEQLRAVADRGGIVGVVFHSNYLGDPYFGGGRLERVVDHLQYIVNLVGEDHAALGSDWDGAIITPRDMPTCLELPRLVQAMLERGFSERCIQKILGQNYLRVLTELRG